ncbi:MAG: DUF1127 domain-containing protein [Bosea sp. (in: a-proteobacteria)]
MIVLSAVLPAMSAVVIALRRAARSLSKAAVAIQSTLRHRREISRLAELDDHQLHDIGLTRTDVHGALAVSMLHDPSHVLCDIAGSSHSQMARAASAEARRVVVIKAMPKEV